MSIVGRQSSIVTLENIKQEWSRDNHCNLAMLRVEVFKSHPAALKMKIKRNIKAIRNVETTHSIA